MLDDAREHAGYLIVETTTQLLTDVRVTLLRQEKFGVSQWIKDDPHWPEMLRALASVSSSGIPCTLSLSISAIRRRVSC
jgi:hypothetical protein